MDRLTIILVGLILLIHIIMPLYIVVVFTISQ